MSDVTKEIESIGVVLSEEDNGWKKEFNKVSWNGREAKWEIRPWNEDHSRCGKGISLSEEELIILLEYANTMNL